MEDLDDIFNVIDLYNIFENILVILFIEGMCFVILFF